MHTKKLFTFTELAQGSDSENEDNAKQFDSSHQFYDNVYQCLFESAERSNEIKGAAQPESYLHTYAILDAAKLPFVLSGLLATSGLTYASLFQGETQEELEEYAPYIVQLDQSNSFTNQLLPAPKQVNKLWDKGLGVFFRSSLSLKDLRQHFRKFIRIRNEQNEWLYFRFWEPNNVHASVLLQNDIYSPLVSVWMNASIDKVLFPQLSSGVVMKVHAPETINSMEQDVTNTLKLSPSTLRLRQVDLLALQNTKRSIFIHKVAESLAQNHASLSAHTNIDELTVLYMQACERSYTIEQAAYDYIRCQLALKTHDTSFEQIEKHVDPELALSPVNRGKLSWAFICDTYRTSNTALEA
ncbi:DUF4123 domain-containing protein [Ningiella sp. W23]|uniref:DUF4123 domain-containing protein n=1 Tax=Ningiella sp. W23 TaxID=3023715 RepID=UPI0037578717